MTAEYKTELGKTYMVIHSDKKEDSFAMQMLEENHIRSLLPFERRCFNGNSQFFYEITGMSSLAERAERTALGEKDVRHLLQGLYCVFEEIHSYFLESDGILLQEAYIFEKQEELFFCYCPEKNDHGFGIELFATNLLDKIDAEDEEALQLAYQFYALVKDAKKGILYILEEVLTKEKPEEKRLFQVSQTLEEIQADTLFAAEEEKEEVRKPDVFMMVCFLLSISSCLIVWFLFSDFVTTVPGLRPALGIILVFSLVGIVLAWTDIDIVRKK